MKQKVSEEVLQGKRLICRFSCAPALGGPVAQENAHIAWPVLALHGTEAAYSTGCPRVGLLASRDSTSAPLCAGEAWVHRLWMMNGIEAFPFNMLRVS